MTAKKPLLDPLFAAGERLLTGVEASAMLNLKRGSLVAYARSGMIPFTTTTGGHRRYRESDIRAFALAHADGQAAGVYNTGVREARRRARVRSAIGKRFGMLVVREQAPERFHSDGKTRRSPEMTCDCDCGGTKIIRLGTLENHLSGWDNCGCLTDQRVGNAVSARHTIHGHSAGARTRRETSSSEYFTWSSMKARCYGANSAGNADYGGRGIRVCDRWLASFSNFLADMGERPSPAHSLDRIDVDGDYEPGNCRWATHKQQMANRRKPVWLSPPKWEVVREALLRMGTLDAAATLTLLEIELGKAPRKKHRDSEAA